MKCKELSVRILQQCMCPPLSAVLNFSAIDNRALLPELEATYEKLSFISVGISCAKS